MKIGLWAVVMTCCFMMSSPLLATITLGPGDSITLGGETVSCGASACTPQVTCGACVATGIGAGEQQCTSIGCDGQVSSFNQPCVPPPPVAPTCVITGAPLTAPFGQSLSLDLHVNGAIVSGSLNGTNFSQTGTYAGDVVQSTAVLVAASSQTVLGSVTGPGGTGTCTAIIPAAITANVVGTWADAPIPNGNFFTLNADGSALMEGQVAGAYTTTGATVDVLFAWTIAGVPAIKRSNEFQCVVQSATQLQCHIITTQLVVGTGQYNSSTGDTTMTRSP